MYPYESGGQYNIYEVALNGVSRMVQFNMRDLLAQINYDLQSIGEISVTFDNINLRDLRRLDHNLDLCKDEAIISLRKNIVIFSIDTTRGLILNNKLYFIVPNGADNILKILSDNMSTRNQNESFEYQAYDSLLQVTKHYDTLSLTHMQIEVESLSRQLKRSSIIPLSVQEKLKTLKTAIANLSKHFTLIKNLLSEILDDDEILSYLNLTLLKDKPMLFEEVENGVVALHREKMSSLFEVYLYDYTNLLFKMNGLNDKIEHEEEYAILKLSLIQNQLMMINMIISILTCVIGFCAYITGLFGMNLDNVNYIQPVPGVFNGVLIATIIFIPVVTFLVIWILKQNELIPT